MKSRPRGLPKFLPFAKTICSTMYPKTTSRISLQVKNSTLMCLLGAFCFAYIFACGPLKSTMPVDEKPLQIPPLNETYEGEKIYELRDITKPPSFPGGEEEMLRYIVHSLRYPSQARARGTEGSVVLSFIVTKGGEIKDVRILREIGNGCGEEAVRLFQSMPKWIPGELFGNAVHVRIIQPVRFKIK